MVIRGTEEVMEKVYEYAEKIIDLQLQKKELDKEIRSLKEEYKEEGIAVGLVSKILNKLKAKKKLTDGDILEEDILTEKIEANEKIQDMLASLNTK